MWRSLRTDVDLVNLVLLIVAWILAIIVPFPLLIFAYVVLGPFHYLTEIPWLMERRYFSATKVVPLLLWMLAGAVTFFGWFAFERRWVDAAILSAITLALVSVVFAAKTIRSRVTMGIASLGLIAALIFFPPFQGPALLFTILLPTVIHTFFFTSSFMITGARRTRRWQAVIVPILFAIGASLTFLPIPTLIPLSSWWHPLYQPFLLIHAALLAIAGIQDPWTHVNLPLYTNTPVALHIARLLAFIYTYHYLNWFSKTQVIHWWPKSTQNRNLILALWFLAVAIYLWNYRLGFLALLFLSTSHVFLEFPLDVITIKGLLSQQSK